MHHTTLTRQDAADAHADIHFLAAELAPYARLAKQAAAECGPGLAWGAWCHLPYEPPSLDTPLQVYSMGCPHATLKLAELLPPGDCGYQPLLDPALPGGWDLRELVTLASVIDGPDKAAAESPSMPDMDGVTWDYDFNKIAARLVSAELMEQDFPEADFLYKYGSSLSGGLSYIGARRVHPVNLESMHNAIWSDPHVYQGLNTQEQMAMSGALDMAWNKNKAYSGSDRIVWPSDMARVAAGMGSGYLSGAIVGKALGALTGMSPGTQEKLRQAGMWTGVIRNALPMLYP